ALGGLSGIGRIRHDRSRRPEPVDRPGAGDDGIAALDPPRRGEHDPDLLCQGSRETAGLALAEERAFRIPAFALAMPQVLQNQSFQGLRNSFGSALTAK